MADEQKKYLSEDEMGFGTAPAKSPAYLSESDMGFGSNGDNALTRGWKKAGQSIAISKDIAAGDTAGAARTIKEASDYAKANPGMKEGSELMDAWKKGDGITGGISGVASEIAKDYREAKGFIPGVASVGKNLQAMGSGIVEQVSNSVAPIAGMVAGGFAGAKGGAAIGGALGSVAGGVGAAPGAALGGTIGGAAGAWAGASAGNAAIEGGFMAQEAISKAGISPGDQESVKAYLDQNRDALMKQAAVKGGIIGAVDTATMGIAGRLLNAPAKAAAGRALSEMGIDAADRTAAKAAMETPAFKQLIANDAVYQASKTGAERTARNMAAAALDPAGEFAGEYLGQGVATGEWDAKNAALEAFSSVGQSAGMFAGQKAYQAIKRPSEADAPSPAQEEGKPLALPAPTYTGTPNDQMLQAEAERANAVAEAEARAAGIYQQRADFEAAKQGQPEQPPVNAGLELVRQAYAAQLDALQQQEQDQAAVPQSSPPDGRAALEAQAAQTQAQREAGRAVMGPDDEILQSTGAVEPPHRAMGIDPAAGPLSAGAAIAVDTGVAGQMQAAAQAVTAQDAAPQAAGPLSGAAQDAGARFIAGEKWSKPGRSGYVIDRVSDDGKMAVARDGNDTFTIGLDVETANGWKPEGRDLGAAQQDPAAAWNNMSMPERAAVAGRVGLPPVVANNIPRTGWEGLNPDLQARISKAMAPAAPATAPSIEGADLGNGWAKFSAESGTAGVPRAEMPQIKAEHRGAMVNFMNARGVAHQEETLPASSLKPTQAEFSREKVARAAGFEGGDRAILVSSDNHILDGHHQWMAAREKGEDVRAIRLNAPIRDLIGLAHDFPSSTKAGGASGPGSDAGNGFKHGPQAGERYRVGQVSSVGGAIALEKRLPAGT
ncbi:MAG: hypothetical protein KAY12_02875, partial [Arenimonas sp.]|nr:hypothetical protein [Arenimonas sp.]